MVPPTPTTTDVEILADTGTTDTLIRMGDSHILSNIRLNSDTLRVRVANNSLITSTTTGDLSLTGSEFSLKAHVFEDRDLGKNLLSISELCNQGCIAEFSKDGLRIYHHDTIILQGDKGPLDKLWTIRIPHTHPEANWSVRLNVDAEVVNWWHATMGYPTVSSFLRMLQWCDIPRLTASMVRANPPNPQATAIGHLNQTRKNQNSTRPRIPTPSMTRLEHVAEGLPDIDTKTDNDVYAQCMTTDELIASGILHVDLTGAFPWLGSGGEKYWLVTVFQNYIHIELMKSKDAKEYVDAYARTLKFFQARGLKPRFLRMDNETSDRVEEFAHVEGLIIQYVPVNTHRRNSAERAIQDVKNHFLAMFWGVPADFPMNRWPLIAPMLELTLNLLRQHGLNVSISAYEGLFRHKFDFRANTMGPFGTPITVHEKSGVRASWDGHGVPGYYLQPLLNTYRSVLTYVPETNGIRSTDTLAWHPQSLVLPGASNDDMLAACIKDLIQALQQREQSQSTSSPSRRIATDTLVATLLGYREQYRNLVIANELVRINSRLISSGVRVSSFLFKI